MARAAGLPPPPLLVKVAASVGFLADAYDLFVINIVTTILRSVYPGARAWSESLVKSAIMVGTIAGQLGFGAAGDRVGRRASFLGSMMVCIAFSLLSGLGVRAVGGRDMSVFVMLAAFRLALGVGIGGEYPLSATITAEAASASVSPNGKSRALATVFSMQGVGNCAAPLLALALLRSRVPLDTVWRVVLACGALPFVLTAPLRWRLSDGLEYAAARKHLRPVREWARDVLVTHGRALLGTAGSWFLFDVVFYGNGLFAADFVELLGPSEAAHTRAGLTRTALASLFVSLLGLPGYWASIACIGDSLRTQRAIQVPARPPLRRARRAGGGSPRQGVRARAAPRTHAAARQPAAAALTHAPGPLRARARARALPGWWLWRVRTRVWWHGALVRADPRAAGAVRVRVRRVVLLLQLRAELHHLHPARVLLPGEAPRGLPWAERRGGQGGRARRRGRVPSACR